MGSEIVFRLSFVFLNLMIGAAGATLIVLGGIFLSMSQELLGAISATSIETFVIAVLFNASVLFIIVGSVIVVFVVIGIIGSIKHRFCGIVLIVYSVTVGFIVVLQLVLVIIIAVRSADAKTFLQNNVTDILTAGLQKDPLLQNGLSQLESFLQCCGLTNSYRDYTNNNITIPSSCNCVLVPNTTCTILSPTIRFNTNNLTSIHSASCIDDIISHLDNPAFQYGLGAGAIAIIVVELLLILFALCMTCLDFKDEEREY